MKHKHYNDVYGVTFWVAVGKDSKEAQKEVAGIFDDHDYMDCLALCLYRNRDFAVCLPRDVDMSIVAHECLHAAHRILDRHSIKLCEGSEEVYAVMVEWCMRKACESLKKMGVKPGMR